MKRKVDVEAIHAYGEQDLLWMPLRHFCGLCREPQTSLCDHASACSNVCLLGRQRRLSEDDETGYHTVQFDIDVITSTCRSSALISMKELI